MEFINKAISLMERMNNIDKYGYSSLLTEISIQDKYQIETQNGKNNLSYETFEFICDLDPTTKNNNVGKYSNWLLSKYNEYTAWDKLRNALEWYADGAKRGILKRLGVNTDINTFNSYDELIDVMDEINHSNTQISNSEYNNRQKFKGQFEILGSTSKFDIITCNTWEAERYFGSGTKWCTVANEGYFNSYTDRGTLFIIYPKNGDSNLKMQFHFEKNEYCDKDNNPYRTPLECIDNVIDNENEFYELLQLCKQIWTEHKELFMTFQERFQERVIDAQQRLNNGEKPENIFDEVWRRDNGIYLIELMGKNNFVRPNNTFVWEGEKWFDGADYFYNGFASVYINRKGWNYLRPDGTLVWKDEKWFNEAYDFINGLAKVYIEGKGYNYLRTDGTLVRKPEEKWFDDAYSFHNGLANVILDDEEFKLDEDGNLHDI